MSPAGGTWSWWRESFRSACPRRGTILARVAIAALRPDGPSRERLCRTALRLFAERGYDGVSNREIVAACGLTKGAIYWYFESKEDLFRTVLSEALQGFQQRLAAVLEGRSAWDDRLRAAFGLFADVLEADDDPHRHLLVLLVSQFPRGPGADRLVSASHENLIGAVQAMLAGREETSNMSDRQAAMLVHAAGLGVLVLASRRTEAARSTLDALLRALGGGGLAEPTVAAEPRVVDGGGGRR
jgi:AcrR family transcriptional regulator